MAQYCTLTIKYLYNVKIKKKYKKILPYIKNKYIITFVAFVVWIAFFDKNDLLSQRDLKNEVHKLETEKSWYLSEVKKNQSDMKELQTNPLTLEKFAREKYMMKRDNEDVFVIVQENSN